MRSGHRTATNKTSAGGFTGYYAHIIIAARAATWNGNPKNLTLGVLPPKYVPHGRAIPAQNDNALNGLNAALAALENFPNLTEIIADRGYTIYGKDFVRPLHRMGINVVMDYTKGHQKKIKTVTIGPEDNEQLLLLHCGTFLVEWTPERFWIPPQNLEGENRAKWYAKRAKYLRKPQKPNPRGCSHQSTYLTAEPFPPKTTTPSTASTLSSSPSTPSPTSQKSSPTRGYTIYGKDFVRPLHRMGINVVMDYTEGHQKKNQDSHDRTRRTKNRYCCSTAAPSS